jgi:hypothetical protein
MFGLPELENPAKLPNLRLGMLGIRVWSVKQPESACCRQALHLILSESLQNSQATVACFQNVTINAIELPWRYPT